MDSLNLDPDQVDNMDMYSSIPPVLMEKCAALSVRPDTVKSLIQSMQGGCDVITTRVMTLRRRSPAAVERITIVLYYYLCLYQFL